MSLSSLQLDAFAEVARTGSFSQAAVKLHITQSALSQRILNLEEELGSSLFIRESSGARLTDLGQKLLRYSESKTALESEFTDELKATEPGELAGRLRVGGYSTILRSVAIPTLRDLLAKNPRVQTELLTREMRELTKLLETGQADFIFIDHAIERAGISNLLLGHEENVLVQLKNGKSPRDTYLDHDEHDQTTEAFFKLQLKAPKERRRSYFDEMYTIIDGVLAGLGRTVMPEHIANKYPTLEIVKGLKPLRTPVYLCHYEQAFYTKLQTAVLDCLVTGVKTHLER
jgi:DNA-binding transcriptional LysR family regulator